MSRTSRDAVGVITAIGAGICLLIAALAIPLGVLWGATHGGLSEQGVVAGLIAWAICEAGGIVGFILLGGTSALSLGSGHRRY